MIAQEIAVLGFLFSAMCGWMACIRSQTWASWPHWCGVVSICALAWLAWPDDIRQPTKHQYIPVSHDTTIVEWTEYYVAE